MIPDNDFKAETNHHLLALVQAHVVVAIYSPDDQEKAKAAAQRMQRLHGWKVSMYELDQERGETAKIGQQVDPEAQHWQAVA